MASLSLAQFTTTLEFSVVFIAPARHHGTAGGLLVTSQYLASSIALTGLTLALGSQPGTSDYRTAFWLLATLAALGAALVAVTRGPAADT